MTDRNTNSEVKRAAKRLADAAYYAKNKEEISRRRALRYRENKEPKNKKPVIYRKQAAYYQRNKDSKKFFCETCNVSCGRKCDLEKHNDTLKHQYAFLNSLD